MLLMGKSRESGVCCMREGEVIHHGQTSVEERGTVGKVNVRPDMSGTRIYFTSKSPVTTLLSASALCDICETHH